LAAKVNKLILILISGYSRIRRLGVCIAARQSRHRRLSIVLFYGAGNA
jgi:hypothetical protein